MPVRLLATIAAVALSLTGCAPVPDTRPTTAAQADCGILFVGSSTIHRWTTLATDLRPWRTDNQGVDGATIRETTIRFRAAPDGPPPRAIILYAGDNDIAGGEPVGDAVADLRAFLAASRERMGAVPVLVVAIKPSPRRLALLPRQTAFNRAARAIAAGDPTVGFVDVASRMMVRGRPGPFYVADGLHMNAAGYRIWRDAVRRGLTAMLPGATVRACARPAAARRG